MKSADEVARNSQAVVSASPLLTSKDEIVELRILLIVFTVFYWLGWRLQEVDHSFLFLPTITLVIHFDRLLVLTVDDGELLVKQGVREKYLFAGRDSKTFLHRNVAL